VDGALLGPIWCHVAEMAPSRLSGSGRVRDRESSRVKYGPLMRPNRAFVGALWAGLLVIGSASPIPASAKATPFSAFTPFDSSGWGPFRLGETLKSAKKALGRNPDQIGYDDFDGQCKKGNPDDGLVMRIESSADDTNRPIVTKGLRAGASKTAIRKAFPNAKQSPHEYTDGVYLDVTLKSKRIIRFELGNGKVANQVFLGVNGAAQLVEGCA
jgi:hypothetical protein